jgi:hypothetical protein
LRNEIQVGESGTSSLLFLVPHVHEEFYHCWRTATAKSNDERLFP